ncbi:MAG: hypothetical protein HN904_03830, partial [Victivallales bacterium]|nr:hypothetical protein [Victivallales bacterium]
FTVGHEDGTFAYPPTQPGGGGVAFRRQMRALKEFIEGLDFIKMTPDNSVVQGALPEGVSARALVEAGKQYAIYFHRSPKNPADTQLQLTLDLPAGTYRAEWLNPTTGKVDKTLDIQHSGGARILSAPVFREDIALRLVLTGK